MDVEKTMEFLLETAVRHDTQIQTIRNLLEGGIKLVNTYQTETNRRFDALLDAQLRTESMTSSFQSEAKRKFDALVDAQLRAESMTSSFQSETNRKFDALVDAQVRTESAVAKLAEAQALTEQKLQRFIDSMNKPPTNGHGD
jgi:hypothetical protein